MKVWSLFRSSTDDVFCHCFLALDWLCVREVRARLCCIYIALTLLLFNAGLFRGSLVFHVMHHSGIVGSGSRSAPN